MLYIFFVGHQKHFGNNLVLFQDRKFANFRGMHQEVRKLLEIAHGKWISSFFLFSFIIFIFVFDFIYISHYYFKLILRAVSLLVLAPKAHCDNVRLNTEQKYSTRLPECQVQYNCIQAMTGVIRLSLSEPTTNQNELLRFTLLILLNGEDQDVTCITQNGLDLEVIVEWPKPLVSLDMLLRKWLNNVWEDTNHDTLTTRVPVKVWKHFVEAQTR